jgi:selenocysteine lyase/cysteine desulfurase
MSTVTSIHPSTHAAVAAPGGAPATEAGVSPLPLAVLGGELSVPLVTGGEARHVNLDYAASAPCLRSVYDAVATLLPWYSSVHRGAGFASTVSTEIYAAARGGVAHFVGARPDDAVVFTRNTTDALNLLAAALPPDTTVVTFASEHHANLLPWRRGRHVQLPVPRSAAEALARAEAALAAVSSRHRLLAVTGASNVTGEIWPLAQLAAIAHHHGARFAVDAAQLAPHRRIDLRTLDADYLALSGHKLYAPFGGGALVGRVDWLDAAEPYLAGGGAVRHVGVDATEWADGHARHEAGTPNVVGAAALAAACGALERAGMDRVAAHEAALLARLTAGLAELPGVDVLSIFEPAAERIGVVAFNVMGWHHGALAAALAAEHGVSVRAGAFCAHPLCATLAASAGGAVRASFGAGTTAAEIDRLLAALAELVGHGPRWQYRVDAGRYLPDPDPRPRPRLHHDLGGRHARGTSPPPTSDAGCLPLRPGN